ncbi:centrosomal protein of 290 kDa-like isoform X2 [Rhopalosiphum padi]|uniref:centrosomal protein of 290 kDa-like isoform X2 n=1 Tax=Rhopalosiphum padi TaxID=40932 RepID=UPI00298D8449|nr:centrosomal protein of 290 kDa-like isoform X2 [Rhopalosiphum padi]
MVQLELSKMLAVSVDDMNEQDLEHWYDEVTVTECDQLDFELDRKQCENMFLIFRRILMYKGEQVDSLMTEIEDLATKQGEEEARRLKKEEESRIINVDDLSQNDQTEVIRKELTRLELENERLSSDVQQQKQEVDFKVKELDKISAQLSKVENERDFLRRELDAVQDDISGRQLDDQPIEDNLTMAERFRDLTESVRQKNQHITQLLNDIEVSEKENRMLKQLLTSTRDELKNATQHLNTLSAEFGNMKCLQDEYTDRIKTLELNDKGLRSQISELVAEKEKCEEQIDELGEELESRIKQLMELLSRKDEEILNYKSRIGSTDSIENQNTYLAKLQETVARQEDQIMEFQKQVHQATNDINRSAAALEQQKKLYNELLIKNKESPELKDLRKKLSETQEQLELGLDKCQKAEEDATEKAEQISKLIIRIREFESGEYGLEEATEQIRKLKQELAVRDNQIKELIDSSNLLHQEADLLEQDNLAMKEKLGLPVDDVVRPKGMMARHKEAQTKITMLQKELDECKEIIVNLKLKNRSLNKSTESVKYVTSDGEDDKGQIPNKSEISKQETDIGSELEDNVKELIEENESLRKGMHEILDSIHNQDGLSVVRIECQSLERLLEAMDARHVAGWYQPGMRLLARINNLEGANSNLRHQIHFLHDALTATKQELINTQKEEEKQKKHNVLEEIKGDELSENLKELQIEQKKSIQLEEEVKSFQNKFQQLQDEMKLVNDEYDNEKQKIKSLVDKLELELKITHNKESDLRERFLELEKSWKTMLEDPDQIKRQLSYNVIKVSGLTEELQVIKRMYQCCLEEEQILKKEKQKAVEEVWTLKAAYSKEMENLLKIQEKQKNELTKLNNQMKNVVDIGEYKILKNDFEVLTAKHREILHLVLFKEDTLKLSLERLMTEVTLLKDQRLHFVIEVANFYGTYDELTSIKAENIISNQRAEHSEKMYSLLKDQMEEMESRCKSLEQNLCDMLEANLQCQTEEVRLRETTVNMVDESEYSKMCDQLKDAHISLEEAIGEKTRLLRILEIAQNQVHDLEQHHKRLDHQHDVLQRRVIELQALSDEKATIDKLMREIANHEVNLMAASVEEMKLKTIIQDQQANIAGLECKNDRILEQHETITLHYRTKISRLEKIIFELQRRYHGTVPLVSEQIWVHHKQKLEEALTITYRKWVCDNKPNDVDEIVFIPTKTTEDYRSKYTELQLKELKVQLTCNDLQKKNQLFIERIEKQDCFIESLEKEIMRMDSDCMHNYLSWGIQEFSNDAKSKPKTLDKQISVQSESSFRTLEGKLEDLNKQLTIANNNIIIEKESNNLTIKKLQTTLTELEDVKACLEKEIFEKDDHIRKLTVELASNDIPEADTQNPALLATIESLETIISQKEETINRLQELLKECREDHTKEIIELQKNTEAHNFSIREKSQKDVSSPIHSNNIKSVVNQYMIRITDLEDRIKQADDDLNQANSEKEHWSGVAERRLKEMEQMKSEDDSKEKDAEIVRLNEIIMGFQNRRDTLPAQRDRLRVELEKMKKKLNDYERREKEDKSEIQKLRQQLIYRPPTGGKRDEAMSVVKEEALLKKIKTLEIQLDDYKKKDEQNKMLRKLKSDEQVGKWEMNKRRQVTNERLQNQLLDMTRECDSLRLNNQRLRDNLLRMEKDRNALELKLKLANVQSSALANSLVDELTLEKDRLSNELYTLRSAKEMMSGGTSLAEVVVELRRKISTLELLQKGGSNALIKEVETLKDSKSRLLKTKAALEEENARLKKIVDRLQLTDNLSGVSSLSSDSDYPSTDNKRTAKLERLVIMLRTAVDKLKEENKNLSLERVVTNIDDKSYVEKLQSELQTTQSYYLDASEKCSQLEQQLQDYRSQYEAVFTENENLKSQLEKKCYLLSKTKTMLQKAAAREQLTMEYPNGQRINNLTSIE